MSQQRSDRIYNTTLNTFKNQPAYGHILFEEKDGAEEPVTPVLDVPKNTVTTADGKVYTTADGKIFVAKDVA